MDPTGPASERRGRVLRGGSFWFPPEFLSVQAPRSGARDFFLACVHLCNQLYKGNVPSSHPDRPVPSPFASSASVWSCGGQPSK